jgi:putative mRNA 3-end processing factor
MGPPLLEVTDSGLYCRPGDFHVDPWRPVPRAVLTHAHADHARPGSDRYLAASAGERLLRVRLGPEAALDVLPYGEVIERNGVRISLHPAGHVLGSAQMRLEHGGHVWVVSGDYKLEPDPTCAPFEPVRCHVFVTESTFGLPIFRWPPSGEVLREVNAWWRSNQEEGLPSLLYGYALGKAQRLLAGLDASIGPVYTHGAVERLAGAYRDSGVPLQPTTAVVQAPPGTSWKGAMIIAPPSANGSAWTRRFGTAATAFASGWMRIRGTRRRRAVDRGFVLSDHADWPGLLAAVRATGAERVLVTHGYVAAFVRFLREQGLDAEGLATPFEGELDEQGGAEAEPEDGGGRA